MRYPRLALALAAASCMLAIAAAPALGAAKKEFYGEPIGAKTKGLGRGEQALKFGQVKIFCRKATANGILGESPSPTYNTSIKFAECYTEAKIGTHPIELATHFVTPIVVEYHNNGFVEVGSETFEEEGSLKLAGGEIELIINGGPKFTCHIRWPTQTIPTKAIKFPELEYSAVVYTNNEVFHKKTLKFPEEKQDRLLFANEWKAIHGEYEGTQCSEWGEDGGPEFKGGRYTGTIEQFLPAGELEFRSFEEASF
jgi:hypothetical protein